MGLLLVMRHAKSDWDAGASDHERPLNPRGVEAARTMGELLARIGEVPDLAMTSTAVRARTTVGLAAEAGGWSTTIEPTRDLYEASVVGALEVAATASDEVEKLMLVGHQPTWSHLVTRLTGGEVALNTATCVGIDLPGSWGDVVGARGVIRFVLQARHFTG